MMKTRLMIAVAAIAGSGLTMAQDSGFSAGLDLQLPIGEFGDLFGLGIGPAVGYDKEAGDQGLLGLTAGFSVLTSKEDFVKGGKEIYITGHYKYFFDDIREGIYVAPMIGWGLVGYKVEIETPLISSSTDQSLGGLSFGAGVGYVVNERIDIGLRYQIVRGTADGDATASAGESSTGLSSIGIRAMYNF